MNLSSQKTGSKVNGLEQSISALGGFTVNYCTFHETLEGVEKLNGSNLNNSGLSLRVQTQLTTLCKLGWGLVLMGPYPEASSSCISSSPV